MAKGEWKLPYEDSGLFWVDEKEVAYFERDAYGSYHAVVKYLSEAAAKAVVEAFRTDGKEAGYVSRHVNSRYYAAVINRGLTTVDEAKAAAEAGWEIAQKHS